MKILSKRFLFFFISISCLVRILFFIYIMRWGEGSWFVFDSQQYHDLAKNIAWGAGIVDGSGLLNFYRLPGYPLWLSFWYWLTNVNVTKTLLAQVVITSIVPLLMMILTAQFILQKNLVWLVGIFSVFHLGFVLYTGMVATEGLFLVVLLLFYITFFRLCDFNADPSKQMLHYALVAGILLGVLSMIRPIGHYLIIVSLGMIVVSLPCSWWQKIKISIVFSLSWLAVVGGWLLRNWLLTGSLFFHSLPGLHFLQYSAANTYMATNNTTYLQARAALLDERDSLIKKEEAVSNKKLNEYERCCLGEKLAGKHIKENIPAFMKYSLVQFTKTMCALHSTHLLFVEQGWVSYDESTSFCDKAKRYLVPVGCRWFVVPFIYLDILTTLFLLLSFILFLIRCLYLQSYRLLGYRLLPFIGLFVFLTIAYGCARLRMPIEPLLIIIAVFVWKYPHGTAKKLF